MPVVKWPGEGAKQDFICDFCGQNVPPELGTIAVDSAGQPAVVHRAHRRDRGKWFFFWAAAGYLTAQMRMPENNNIYVWASKDGQHLH